MLPLPLISCVISDSRQEVDMRIQVPPDLLVVQEVRIRLLTQDPGSVPGPGRFRASEQLSLCATGTEPEL